jgi:heme A synthase
MARAAARLVRNWRPVAKQSGQAAKNWIPTARQSGKFVKHVLPAAVKPIHSLWHEILAFVFLLFAAIGAWKIWQHPGALPPTQFAVVVIFVAVMAGYGISSYRKARRISRS